MTYIDALHRFEACREQSDQSMAEYLESKVSGSANAYFTASAVLAEAHCMEREAARALEGVVADEMSAVLNEERASSEQLLERRA